MMEVASKLVSNPIISNPGILGGTPVFKGTRVPICNLIEYLESGYTLEDFFTWISYGKKNSG